MGHRPGLRPLLRRLRTGRHRAHGAQRDRTARRRGDRRRACLARRGAGRALLLLGPLLRSALALRTAGTVRRAVPEPPIRRRDRLCRLPGRAAPGLARRERAGPGHGRHRDGRPRRKPGRARRVRPWLLHLRRGDPGSFHRPRALRHDAGAPGGGGGPRGGRLAHRLRSARRGSGPGRPGRFLPGGQHRSAPDGFYGAAPACLRRGCLPALPLRLERPSLATRREHEVRRGAASRVVRPRRGPG